VTPRRFAVAALVIGLAVLTVWIFVESMNASGTAQIVGYQHTGDDRKLVVVVGIGLGDDIAERQVQENANEVRITVRTRTPSGPRAAVMIYTPVTVSLREALGTRAVYDDKARAVPDLGAYQVPGPSPARP